MFVIDLVRFRVESGLPVISSRLGQLGFWNWPRGRLFIRGFAREAKRDHPAGMAILAHRVITYLLNARRQKGMNIYRGLMVFISFTLALFFAFTLAIFAFVTFNVCKLAFVVLTFSFLEFEAWAWMTKWTI